MWRKLRFYLALFSAIINRNKRGVALGITILLIFVFVLKVLLPSVLPKISGTYEEFKKPTFVEGVVGEPTHPNPLFDSTETQRDISKLVFRGLTKVDMNGNLVGDLASEFKRISETEYVFKLKEGVFWQDGERFTSDDVIHTIEIAKNPKYESTVASNFKDVQVERIDDFLVRFTLKEPFTPFPFTTTVGVIPKHIALKKYRPIGTGPFKVKSITKDTVILSSKNLNLVFRFYASFEDATVALKLGEIHSLGGLTPQEVSEIETFGGKNIYRHGLPFRQAIVFFNTKAAFLKIKEVRQALAYSIDKDFLASQAGGERAVVAKSQLPLETWVLATVKRKERYEYSMDQAQEFLKKAGFELENNVWTKDGKGQQVTIVSANDPELRTVVNLLKETWTKLGLKVKTDIVEIEKLRKTTIPSRDFQVLVDFQEIPADPDQYVLWHTTQTRNANITGISSAKLDKLLEDSRKISGQKKRADRYVVFTTLLLDEAPAVFLYYPQYIWVVSKKVAGIDLSDFRVPGDRFHSYKNWKIREGLPF